LEDVGAFGLGLMEQYVKPFGEVWQYLGITDGYASFYVWVPDYDTVVSVMGNKVEFSEHPYHYIDALTFHILDILKASPEWVTSDRDASGISQRK